MHQKGYVDSESGNTVFDPKKYSVTYNMLNCDSTAFTKTTHI